MAVDRTAWNPCGKTINIDAAAAAPVGLVSVQLANDAVQYRVMNDGLVTAFVAFGSTGAIAQTNAAIPTDASAAAYFSIPVPAGAIEVITAPPNSFWSAITASSTAAIYITPGRGV